MKWTATLILIIGLYSISCKKDSHDDPSQAMVRLSASILDFDTIFTSTRSVTKQVLIYNDNDRRLQISKISLRGGSDSYYRFVADGQPGPDVTNVEIGAHDSIYIFVTVSIDTTQSILPFAITDTLDIAFGTGTKKLALVAWGQNAYFLNSRIITSDTTFTNNLPIVIYGGLLVAKGVTLNIDEGSQIFMHADAPIIVDGRLVVMGGQTDSAKVVFQGDRLDEYYKNLPGSWPGIYFTEESSGSFLSDAVIKNAYQGIAAQGMGLPGEEKVTLERSLIFNCYDAGMVALSSSVRAVNSIVYNCGREVLLIRGGKYNFIHCTIAATGNSLVPHKQPVFTLTDFYKEGDSYTFGSTDASFMNCIFWGSNGSVENEVVVSREGTEAFNLAFTSCLWKNDSPPSPASITAAVANEDPMFTELSDGFNKFDLRPAQGSAAIDRGTPSGVAVDYDGKNRVNTPDIGAFESTF